MQRTGLVVAIAPLVLGAALISCGDRPGVSPPDTPTGIVSGTIRGTDVTLPNATFDGDLALFAGDGWGFNPSLLLFLFLDDDGPPEGQEIVVTPEDDGSSPHVHYRWRDPDSGELDVDAVTDDFELRLRFGRVEDGLLPGTIVFAVPGEDTRVEGAFRASVED